MPKTPRKAQTPSPIGMPITEDIHTSLDDPAISAEHQRLAPFEALAGLVIMRRGALGLSQQELATRMHTTASAISRIESGQHATNARTLMRLADALHARAILGFEYGTPTHPQRQLVVL